MLQQSALNALPKFSNYTPHLTAFRFLLYRHTGIIIIKMCASEHYSSGHAHILINCDDEDDDELLPRLAARHVGQLG